MPGEALLVLPFTQCSMAPPPPAFWGQCWALRRHIPVPSSLGLAVGGVWLCDCSHLPVLLYPPSLHLPVATARCARSARAPFQQQIPFSSFQAPQHWLALALGRRELFLPARLLSPAWCRLSTSPHHGCQDVVHFPYDPLQNLLLNAGAGNKR